MNIELIQLIDIIGYRLKSSLENANKEYFDFMAGHDSRSPIKILDHLVDVSMYGLKILNVPKANSLANTAAAKVEANFDTMKNHLSNKQVDSATTKKLINGPLSDCLTHIGQLAFLRRLAGNHIVWEDYTKSNT